MPPPRTNGPQAKTRGKGEGCKKVGVKLSGDKWASVLEDNQAAQQCNNAALSDARSAVEAKGKSGTSIKSVSLAPTETGGKATFVVTEANAVEVKGILASCKFPLLCKVYADELKKMSRAKKPKTPTDTQSNPETKSNLAQLVERVSSGVSDFFNAGDQTDSCQFSLPGTKWEKLVSEREPDCRNAVCDDISEMIPNSFNRNTFKVDFVPQKSNLIIYCIFAELSGNKRSIEARQAELKPCLFPRLKALYSGQRPSLVWPAEKVLLRPRKLSHFFDDDELVEDSEVGRDSTLRRVTKEDHLQEEFIPVEEHTQQVEEQPRGSPENLYAEEHIPDRENVERPPSLPSSQIRKGAVYRQISSASVKGFRLEFEGEAWPILLNSFNHVFVEALRNDLLGAFSIIGKTMPDVEINITPTEQGSSAEIHFADAETSSADEDNERYDLFSQYSYDHLWDKYNELLGQCEGHFGSNPDFTLLLSGSHWPVLLEKYPHVFQKAAQDDGYLALRASGEPQPPMIKSSITLQGEHARLLYYIAFNSNPEDAKQRIAVLQNYPFPTVWATYAMYSTALISSIEVPAVQRKLRTPIDLTPIEYYPKETLYSQNSYDNSRDVMDQPLAALPAIPTACIGVQTQIPLTSTGMQTPRSVYNSIGMQTYPLFSQECVGVQTNQPKLTSIGLQATGDRSLQACIAVQTNKTPQQSVAMQTHPIHQSQSCVAIQTSRTLGTSVAQQTRKVSQTSVGIQKASSFNENPESPVLKASPKMIEQPKPEHCQTRCHCHCCSQSHCCCRHVDRCYQEPYVCGCPHFRGCDHDFSHRNTSVRLDINFNTNTNENFSAAPINPKPVSYEAPQPQPKPVPLYREGTPESARIMPLYREGTPESARIMPLYRDGTPESARIMPLYRDGTPESARTMSLYRDGSPVSAQAMSLNKDGTTESVWAVSFNQDGSPRSVRTVSIYKDGPLDSRAASVSRGPEKQSNSSVKAADQVNRSGPAFNSVYSSVSELDTASTNGAKPVAWAQAPPHVNSSVASYDQVSNPPMDSVNSSGKTYRVGFPGKEWTAIAERNIKAFVSTLEDELKDILPIHHAIVEEVYTDEVYGIIATVRVFEPLASSKRIRGILKVASFPSIWKLYEREQFHFTPRLKCIDLPPVRSGKGRNPEKAVRNVITCHTVHFDGIGWYQILHANRRILVDAVEKDLLCMGQFPVSDVAVGNPMFDKRGAAVDLRIDHPADLNVESYLHPKNFKTVWRLYRGQRKAIQSS